ncbi:Vacuolar protein sorting-associated protein 26B [Camellia lanceoleosa]|uniref:Vacuolar protein sorting-associated protein 26B n=1 Tax=Camellia lanceoleosa TaxID=1840588 RepID=A0ACC0H5L6_9ERIC|nr:Vacuolar protein sorting-associated protein 26B [Camellia lanceoleosa]
MDAIDEFAQLADSMRQASALLADEDVDENSSSSRRPSTFLNVVALGNTVPMKKENGQTVMIPLFQSQENIAGKISIELVQGKKVEHNGIKIELLGQIDPVETHCLLASRRTASFFGRIYEDTIYKGS